MNATSLAAHLRRLGACPEAVGWARGKSGAVAWRTCERGNWMLWLTARAGVRRQDVVLAACVCARLALPHIKKGEERPLRAIETAERWARGDVGVSLVDVRAAAAAADAADAAADAYAAYAAAAAADAADAAAADYAAAARTKILAKCAGLVRAQIPWSAVEKALAAQSKEAA